MTIRERINAPVVRAVLGTVLQAAVWLFIGYSIFAAYDRFDQAVALQGETRQLRSELYGSIYGTIMFAGSLALIGLVLTIDAAVRAKYRARWFFRVSLILAVPICVIFPVGTLVGAGFIIYLVVKRKEFRVLN